MQSSKRKRAKNPAYKKGDIIALKRHNDYLEREEYRLIFVLDVWYVKTNHYQYISLEQRQARGKLDRIEIYQQSENKFLDGYGWCSNTWKVIELNDLSLLLVCGHPRQCVKEALQSKAFEKKIQSNIKKGQNMLDNWNNINERSAELRRKMEKEDAKITSSQPV